MVGAEAADRLEALDRAHAAWDARLAAFHEARAVIDNDASLPAAAKADQIERLLASSFTAAERLRVETIDRINEGRTASSGARRD